MNGQLSHFCLLPACTMYPRSSTRESGLRTVIKFMLHSSDLEPVLAMQETLLRSLIGVARGKGPESQVTAGGETWIITQRMFGHSYEEVHLVSKSPRVKMHAFAYTYEPGCMRERYLFMCLKSRLFPEILLVFCHIPQDILKYCIHKLV